MTAPTKAGGHFTIRHVGEAIERDGRIYAPTGDGYFTPAKPKAHEHGARLTGTELCCLQHPLEASRRRWRRVQAKAGTE